MKIKLFGKCNFQQKCSKIVESFPFPFSYFLQKNLKKWKMHHNLQRVLKVSQGKWIELCPPNHFWERCENCSTKEIQKRKKFVNKMQFWESNSDSLLKWLVVWESPIKIVFTNCPSYYFCAFRSRNNILFQKFLDFLRRKIVDW